MLSVIVPVHNAEKALLPAIPRIQKTVEKLGKPYEVIIAEDGSTDRTVPVAKSLESGTVRMLSSRQRLGRGAALTNAIRSSRGEIVLYMDADLATDVSHVRELIEKIEKGFDIATGSRLLPGSGAKRSPLRGAFSRVYNVLVRLAFNSQIRDHQCGFKAFRRSAVLPILPLVKNRHWFWDTELLVLAQRKGLRVAEIPVRWKENGSSTVNLLSDVVCMFFEIVRLRLSPPY